MRRIKLQVVDDSAVVRKVVQELLADEPDMELVGAASDPIFAMRQMAKQWPDVILLDVEMPRMDGVTFLRKLMAERPTPVVICSTLTEQGAATTVDAMQAGAVEILAKPKIGLKAFLSEERGRLLHAIRSAAQARMCRMIPLKPPVRDDSRARPVMPRVLNKTTDRIVALGTSTGGTQALELVLKDLPVTVPGMVVVQHMPEKFTKAFAERLNRCSAIEVREAGDGDRVLPGRALIAPGGRHMQLVRNGAQYQVRVKDGPLVNRHKPSVDVLFRSVAAQAGSNALGIIMTGMGDDGAAGLLDMREAGAGTAAQDEESCVVYGMPKEAVRKGAVDTVVGLNQIANEIVRFGGE